VTLGSRSLAAKRAAIDARSRGRREEAQVLVQEARGAVEAARGRVTEQHRAASRELRERAMTYIDAYSTPRPVVPAPLSARPYSR
jgi:hypothetical protein